MTQILPEGVTIKAEHRGRVQFNVRVKADHPAVRTLQENPDCRYVNPLVPAGTLDADLVYRGKFGGRHGGFVWLNFMQSHLKDGPGAEAAEPEFEIE